VTEAGRSAERFVVWRHGSRKSADNPTAVMRSRFLALRVRPANRNIPRNPDGSLPECRLPAEWPTGEPEPTDYWLSTMPADIRLRDLVKLAKRNRLIRCSCTPTDRRRTPDPMVGDRRRGIASPECMMVSVPPQGFVAGRLLCTDRRRAVLGRLA
jgi:hypothetical protein